MLEANWSGRNSIFYHGVLAVAPNPPTKHSSDTDLIRKNLRIRTLRMSPVSITPILEEGAASHNGTQIFDSHLLTSRLPTALIEGDRQGKNPLHTPTGSEKKPYIIIWLMEHYFPPQPIGQSPDTSWDGLCSRSSATSIHIWSDRILHCFHRCQTDATVTGAQNYHHLHWKDTVCRQIPKAHSTFSLY